MALSGGWEWLGSVIPWTEETFDMMLSKAYSKKKKKKKKSLITLDSLDEEKDVACCNSIFGDQYHIFALILKRPSFSSIASWLKFEWGLPWWLSDKESDCQCRRHGFSPWFGKISHAMGQLGLCTTTAEPVLQNLGAAAAEPMYPRAHAPQEKPPRWETCSATGE